MRLLPVVLALAACVSQGVPEPSAPAPKATVTPSLVSIVQPPRTPNERPPLLILLHGIGSDEQDLLSIAAQLDPRFAVASARAPVAQGPGRNAWFAIAFGPGGVKTIDATQAERSRQLLLSFIDEAVAATGTDPRRVYLAGFSQGGIMALTIALTAPEKIAGVVAMSSRVLPEIQRFRVGPERTQGLPALVVHGVDDDVLPIQNGRTAAEVLKGAGLKVSYQEFPMGHTISRESLATVSAWLTARIDGK